MTPYFGDKRIRLWAKQSGKAVLTNIEELYERRKGELQQKLKSERKKERMQRGSTEQH